MRTNVLSHLQSTSFRHSEFVLRTGYTILFQIETQWMFLTWGNHSPCRSSRIGLISQTKAVQILLFSLSIWTSDIVGWMLLHRHSLALLARGIFVSTFDSFPSISFCIPKPLDLLLRGYSPQDLILKDSSGVERIGYCVIIILRTHFVQVNGNRVHTWFIRLKSALLSFANARH